MRGITEERLGQIIVNMPNSIPDASTKSIVAAILSTILAECKELDTWQPIDANTPKDRRMLLKFGNLKVVGQWRQLNKDVGYFVHDLLQYEPPMNQPTHWQDISKDY